MQAFELGIITWIRESLSSPVLDFLMPKLSLLGEFGLIWIVIAVCFLFLKPYRRCGIATGVGLVSGVLIGNAFLKNVIARPRPCWIDPTIPLLIAVPADYSFPSGHTLSGFIAATVIYRRDKRLGITAYILASVIAFSRLYLYVHYPSDVLAGILLGIGIGILADRLTCKYLGNNLGC